MQPRLARLWRQALTEPLVLGSASPRRRDILRDAGLAFTIHPSHAEEHLDTTADSQQQDESGAQCGPKSAVCHARKTAHLQAIDVADHYSARLVIGADTIVAIDNQVLGKPADSHEAEQMLRLLSGRTHEVTTALAIAYNDSSSIQLVAEDHLTSRVTFKTLTASQIRRYVDSGEPMDKAGAYAVQGLGADIVERVEGSYLNVVGLPVDKLVAMLQTLGWPLPQTGEIESSNEGH